MEKEWLTSISAKSTLSYGNMRLSDKKDFNLDINHIDSDYKYENNKPILNKMIQFYFRWAKTIAGR